MPNREELLQKANIAEMQRISLTWMANTPDYIPSKAAGLALQNYLTSKNLPWAAESFDEALASLKAGRFDFAKAQQEDVAGDPNALPPVPAKFPKLETRADIRALSPERYRALYSGPDGAAFKARVNEIQKRGL